ncbi:WYL domain-containing protein [Paenibacillus sp. F6_3S_P_1C]|uniref:WYL domain-containing protein n=1 Tax=Paenibacillus vandeheii TaxID=3035917 RepID=A0ABT8JGU4_9BACL|nr:WYL domain-containing protein [Paenibacillus vandeheii]MDN4604294.1 WYL domain-containing protein [Paenibacillus vandeheii]
MAAVQNIVIQITYQNIRSSSNPYHSSNPDKPNPRPSIRTIQPIALYAMKGYWYCQAYDLDKQAYRVFRCDRITSPQMTDIEPITHINELNLQDAHSLWKPSENAIPFKCLINETGVELFQQEQFPSMQLINESGADSGRTGHTYLVGSYEAHELEFIIRYLASFGNSIKIMEPDTLKESLRQHYLDLLDHV